MKIIVRWIVLTICLCNTILVNAETADLDSAEIQSEQTKAEKSRSVDIVIFGQFGYHLSQMSYGAMLGLSKGRSGGYIKCVSNFNSFSTDRECDNLGYDTATGEMLYFYDEANKARMSITAGYMYQPLRSLRLSVYGGLGYGYRTLAWRERYDDVVMVAERSFKGVAADLGGIYQVGRIAISAGVTAVDFKYSELNIGVGFIF